MKIIKSILTLAVFTLVVNVSAQVNPEKAKKKFAWVDADDNKEVTMEEMKEFHKDKKNKKGEPVKYEMMFYGLDSNDDGKLTIDEFIKPVNWKAAKEKMKTK